jgi:tetratricopeptide (TPR) repeat protein
MDYRSKDACRLAGVPQPVLRQALRAGYVVPIKGRDRHRRYSFQDLVILRTVHALQAQGLSPRRVNACLRKLRESLPPHLPLSGLAIAAIGERIVVREGPSLWHSESGQFLLALEVQHDGRQIRIMQPTTPRPPCATDEYETAHALEESNAGEALAAYRRCLALNQGHTEARINCGRLLHLAGELAAAERMYREAQEVNATLLFNWAVVLEDLGREEKAISLYRESLDLDPTLADAHFNLARLHERASRAREALRHLMAYRRLIAG